MLKSWIAATRNKLLRPGRRLDGVRDERGSAMVEFALVVPALLAITLGIIEFSGVVFAQNLLEGRCEPGVEIWHHRLGGRRDQS